MNLISSITLLGFVAVCVTNTLGNPYVISDERVRSLDVTPVLGRGYSIMTNSFQSTCLDVRQTTIPSFNYEYEFEQLSSSDSSVQAASASAKNSFSWWWINNRITKAQTTPPPEGQTQFYIMAMMKIERYYSSVKEDRSPITPMAQILLDRQDYINFFKTCGPNYVRGIRRAQEVTAIFEFLASSPEDASAYSSNIGKSYGYTEQSLNNPSYQSINKSLSIVIKGYGLGLTEQGSESLVARNLEDFNKVMKFAYNQMTKSPYANHVGMVYGIEVAPWIEHLQFQISARLADEAILIPQPKSLIPVAYRRDGNSTGAAFNNDADTGNRDDFRCKDNSYSIDKYGYCCASDSLYDYVFEEYSSDNAAERVCRPVRALDPAIIKENVASNGEFVARLDNALRYKINLMSTLEKCISAVNAIPASYDHFFLKAQGSVKYDKDVEGIFTVLDMKVAVDPFNDYAVLLHVARELDEFLEMFYSPCLAALFGTNIGTSSSTEPSYFMAYPWYAHDECNYLTCLAFGFRWNREGGGCVPGALTGDVGYKAADQSECADESSADCKCPKDENNVCKVSTADVKTYRDQLYNCWGDNLPTGSVSYFIEHFCMPSISTTSLGEEEIEYMKERMNGTCQKLL